MISDSEIVEYRCIKAQPRSLKCSRYASSMPLLSCPARNRSSVEMNRSRRRREYPRDDVEKCRLARSVWTDNTKKLVHEHCKRKTFKRRYAAKLLRNTITTQPRIMQSSHAPP